VSEHLNLAPDPQAALEYAYPRWQVWQVEDTAEWWAAIRTNLTKWQLEAGCESYRYAATPGELAQLLDAQDEIVGVARTTVHLVAWGRDEDHVRRAYGEVAMYPVRPLWTVAHAASTTTEICPLSTDDPRAIVAHAGDGWAYAVYPVGYRGV
jgi:hypothetical protein